jgi:hypothetical protein
MKVVDFMRIQRFTDEPKEGIKVCRICGYDEREINVYEDKEGYICAECDCELSPGCR